MVIHVWVTSWWGSVCKSGFVNRFSYSMFPVSVSKSGRSTPSPFHSQVTTTSSCSKMQGSSEWCALLYPGEVDCHPFWFWFFGPRCKVGRKAERQTCTLSRIINSNKNPMHIVPLQTILLIPQARGERHWHKTEGKAFIYRPAISLQGFRVSLHLVRDMTLLCSYGKAFACIYVCAPVRLTPFFFLT